MTNLMKYVDVCIGNEEDAELVLGFKPGDTDVTSGELELAGYKSIFEQMVDKFNFEYCVSSLRVSHSASDNGWSACIYPEIPRSSITPKSTASIPSLTV